MGTLILITNQLLCNFAITSENSAVLITLIICVTIICLALIIKGMICKGGEQPTETSSPVTQPSEANTDNKNEKNLKRKQDYQDRLIGFMEKRAIKKETTTKDGTKNENVREYDDKHSEAFIKKMEDLINELGS